MTRSPPAFLSPAAAAPRRGAPPPRACAAHVGGELVVVAGPRGRALAAVVGRGAGGRAPVARVVRRAGGDAREAFVDHGAAEEEVEVLADVSGAEWGCRQMDVDNPHGEAVEDFWLVSDEEIAALGAEPLEVVPWE